MPPEDDERRDEARPKHESIEGLGRTLGQDAPSGASNAEQAAAAAKLGAWLDEPLQLGKLSPEALWIYHGQQGPKPPPAPPEPAPEPSLEGEGEPAPEPAPRTFPVVPGRGPGRSRHEGPSARYSAPTNPPSNKPDPAFTAYLEDVLGRLGIKPPWRDDENIDPKNGDPAS